ncbi:hypothetical protein C8R44DRAFT_774228 [Mycena epipterygia]|nr:hypothetical protein C8R44DRAFT_774228 [Mycena epipterygia]
MPLSAAVSPWSWPFSWMVAVQARWPRCVILHLSLWRFYFFPGHAWARAYYFCFLFRFYSSARMLAASRCSTQACLLMISLSIQRLNSDHRDSAFRGFDVYVGATNGDVVKYREWGHSKKHLSVLGALFFLSVGSGGSTFWLFWGLTFYTDSLFPPVFLHRYQRWSFLSFLHF